MAGLYLCHGSIREPKQTLFVGTFFALLAGNLRRKYPSEWGFSTSDISQHLRRALNSDDRKCQSSLLESTTRSSERNNNARDDLAPDNSKPELSSADLKNHSPKSPPKTDESPPKCTIPISTSMMRVGRLFWTEPNLGKVGYVAQSQFFKPFFFLSNLIYLFSNVSREGLINIKRSTCIAGTWLLLLSLLFKYYLHLSIGPYFFLILYQELSFIKYIDAIKCFNVCVSLS